MCGFFGRVFVEFASALHLTELTNPFLLGGTGR